MGNATATGPASGRIPGRTFAPNSVSVGADRVRGVHPSDALFPDESEEPTESTDAARRDALLSSLNPAQREAVLHAAPVLRIIAGAGSGKTRVLTRRIARRALDGDIDARRVLAVTFTRRAAAELRSRLGQLGLREGVNAGTFHAVAFTQLRRRWEERGITPPELLDRKVGFVAGLMRDRSSTLPLDVVSEIEWAKARMITAAAYPAAAAAADRTPPIDFERVADVYRRYEEEKLARRLVDFDDLLRLATRDIEADPEYAAARRWRFRHFFVDEFQDVNPLQFRLLRAWTGPDADLCVVGDPNQAIYAWNGADSSYLDHFDRHFAGAATVELTDNYRSTPQIIGLANAVLSRTSARRFRLVPHRGDGPVPEVHALLDEVTEARSIARRVRDRHAPGARWADQAVLVRTNAQLAALEEAFSAAKIPTRSRGGGSLLEQPEVRDALRRLGRPGGSLPVAVTDLASEVDAGLAAMERAEANANEGVAPAGAPIEDTAPAGGTPNDDGAPDERGRSRSPHGPSPLGTDRLRNVAELVRLAREFLDLEPAGNGPSFVTWVRSALRSESTNTTGDAVDLATFHAAKGLEWPIVHLAGIEEGLVPIHYARTAEAEAEEHRLLYVAITRAERELHVSWAQRRTFGSRSINRRPSPHLEVIELAISMLADAASPADLAAAVRQERAKLRQAAGDRPGRRRAIGREEAPDLDGDAQALLERLKAWRRDQARAANVPAYVVFNDATLTAVARARPRSNAALLQIAGVGPVKAQRYGPELLRLVGAE